MKRLSLCVFQFYRSHCCKHKCEKIENTDIVSFMVGDSFWLAKLVEREVKDGWTKTSRGLYKVDKRLLPVLLHTF